MSIENEAMAAAAADEIREDLPGSGPVEQPVPRFRFSDLFPDMSFIMSETGPGPVEDYIDHPMNIKGSRGAARILRGVTGMLGNLNYAIIDITLGTFEVMREGKQAHAEADDGKQ